MGLIKEFREFASRGSVIDLAVGIMIGAAFNKVVDSLVKDIITPPLSLLTEEVDFSNLKVHLTEEVTLNIGHFIQTCLDFVIVAFAIFLIVKAANRLRRKKEEKKAEDKALSREEVLLTEIRDTLRNK